MTGLPLGLFKRSLFAWSCQGYKANRNLDLSLVMTRTNSFNIKAENMHLEDAEIGDLPLSIKDEAEDDGYLDFTHQEEQKMVRKVDAYLLTTIFAMYLLSYMDRTNIANAKVAGLMEDLKMDSGNYSISLIVFFVFYVIFEVPANLIMVKVGPIKFVPTIMVIWGVLTCCFSAVKTYGQLVALRCLVGIFEAGFAPSILLILSSWYKKEEQSKRFAIYISAAILSGAFGGIIAGVITDHLENVRGIAGWRWLFIIEGAGTIFVALVAFVTLLPFPHDMKPSKGFTQRDIDIAVARLKMNNVDNSAGSDISASRAVWLNFMSLRFNLLVLGYMVIVGSSTLSYFYPTLVKGLGYSGSMVQYMTIPIYAAAFVLNLIIAYISDRYQNLRPVLLTVLLFCSGVFSLVVVLVYGYTERYAMLVLMASCLWSANALALSYSSIGLSHKDSKTRGVGLALINAFGNLAQIYGSYLFPSDDSPKYIMGFGVITGMCFFGFLTYGCMALYPQLMRLLKGKAFASEELQIENPM
ncbi:hypothetical protein OGAPHI_004664 [Ogataea philodendri]|uniref:Major facilitator superfamily (MFS) profile domain-containing protein n=1 Tax=Ogataea philodendri TaxID=1378263 RepID=A0A9P8T3F7_9ASCO|nr:uncharacterized protein OGAPHI_004664 [Ogataea philodendri]KAH3663950.1 hypothetical protein OGAPHI_004664 [Ogataea philodendri]